MYHLYGESRLYGNGVTDLITGPSIICMASLGCMVME